MRPVWGNTPTGVGKTTSRNGQLQDWRKHPHGRGEDEIVSPGQPVTLETPPRAWGRRLLNVVANDRGGNTPTGVGKTIAYDRSHNSAQKHPHGRGEDVAPFCVNARKIETPPQAWGRHTDLARQCLRHGNTPTGVGKKPLDVFLSQHFLKHPHGRGEDELHSCMQINK